MQIRSLGDLLPDITDGFFFSPSVYAGWIAPPAPAGPVVPILPGSTAKKDAAPSGLPAWVTPQNAIIAGGVIFVGALAYKVIKRRRAERPVAGFAGNYGAKRLEDKLRHAEKEAATAHHYERVYLRAAGGELQQQWDEYRKAKNAATRAEKEARRVRAQLATERRRPG